MNSFTCVRSTTTVGTSGRMPTGAGALPGVLVARLGLCSFPASSPPSRLLSSLSIPTQSRRGLARQLDELDAIAAAAAGGCRRRGGQGAVPGIVTGAVILNAAPADPLFGHRR